LLQTSDTAPATSSATVVSANHGDAGEPRIGAIPALHPNRQGKRKPGERL